MNPQFKNWLSEFAECTGATVEFPDAMPVLVTGREDGQPCSLTVTLDQPESDLIFNILCAIGHFAFLNGNPRPWPLPWWLNRPYENETLGDLAYKAKRALRWNLNPKWQTELWAMGVYCQLPLPQQLASFFKRHPEKKKLLWLFWYGALVSPSVQKFQTCWRILRCFLAAKFEAQKR